MLDVLAREIPQWCKSFHVTLLFAPSKDHGLDIIQRPCPREMLGQRSPTKLNHSLDTFWEWSIATGFKYLLAPSIIPNSQELLSRLSHLDARAFYWSMIRVFIDLTNLRYKASNHSNKAPSSEYGRCRDRIIETGRPLVGLQSAQRHDLHISNTSNLRSPQSSINSIDLRGKIPQIVHRKPLHDPDLFPQHLTYIPRLLHL